MRTVERLFAANRVSVYILFVIIAVAPLPFGSRDSTTVALWCFLLGFGLVVASPRRFQRGHLALLAGIGFVVACYGFVLHEQLSEHPWVAEPNPIWSKTAELLGRQVQPSVSIIRGESFYALGKALAAVLALLLGLVVGTDSNRARQALLVVAWSGAGYAIYGLATIQGGALTATFINRNTAAPFFGSCAVVWLILLMRTIRGRLPAGPIEWTEVLEQFDSKVSKHKVVVVQLCMLFVCLVAMFMTTSRAGILVSMFGLLIAFLLFLRRDLPRGLGLLAIFIGAGVVIAILLKLMGSQLEGRIDAGGLTEQGRYAAYQSTLRIIADYPWFGTGWGTFPAIFPLYRSGDISTWGVWDLAHSTPLELAAELGVPLAAVVAFAWLVAILVLLRGTTRSRRETVAPLAALAVAIIANLHSSVDFSLQVPGFSIVVFAVTGIGLAQSFRGGETTTHSTIHDRHRRRTDAQNH